MFSIKRILIPFAMVIGFSHVSLSAVAEVVEKASASGLVCCGLSQALLGGDDVARNISPYVCSFGVINALSKLTMHEQRGRALAYNVLRLGVHVYGLYTSLHVLRKESLSSSETKQRKKIDSYPRITGLITALEGALSWGNATDNMVSAFRLGCAVWAAEERNTQDSFFWKIAQACSMGVAQLEAVKFPGKTGNK